MLFTNCQTKWIQEVKLVNVSATISSQEIGELLENKDSKNTKKRVNQSSTIFKQFLIENGLSAEMKDHSLDRLDQHLANYLHA